MILDDGRIDVLNLPGKIREHLFLQHFFPCYMPLLLTLQVTKPQFHGGHGLRPHGLCSWHPMSCARALSRASDGGDRHLQGAGGSGDQDVSKAWNGRCFIWIFLSDMYLYDFVCVYI